ncbi:MAG: hypothetical protein ABIK97_01010 [candidate division WOR-3 bacterium]
MFSVPMKAKSDFLLGRKEIGKYLLFFTPRDTRGYANFFSELEEK